MLNTKSFHQPQKLNGFSVIELMVALAITAFLLIGLVQIFSSVRASYDLQEGLSRLQENARFATSFMQDQLRDIDYLPIAENQNPAIDIGFNLQTLPNPGFLSTNTQDGGGTAGDTLEVNLFDDRDCSGNLNVITPSGNAAIGQKQIAFTHNAGTNELQFTCRYAATPSVGVTPAVQINNQPVLGNVETLQFQYGEDCPFTPPDPPRCDTSADVYVDAANLVNPGNVVAIRVGLILTSPQIGTLPPDNQMISLLNNNFPASGERELRRPVVFNINLRNRTL